MQCYCRLSALLSTPELCARNEEQRSGLSWKAAAPTHTCRASYDTNNTKKHDEDAMRYLSYALYPLVGGYAIYSLMYKSHKSW